ncbi:MAG: right-handed parallel beta-helix repeat-containing protein, partial [Cyanobacteria bacterium J06642_11]
PVMAWNMLQKVSVYTVLALLFGPAYSPIAHAQDTETPVHSISPRVGVDFNTPRSGDDERSYGRVTGFLPLWQTPGNGLTFLDTAIRLNSTGDLGGTVTLGHRFLKNNMVLGGHLSYDVRDTGNNTFNQLGFGLEAFGDKWDVHLNGYLPVGDTQQSAGSIGTSSGASTTSVSGAQFQGNQLVFATTTTGGGSSSELIESAWGGVDLDAGMQLADWDDWGQLWGYGGVYYHGDAIGGRLRVDHRVEDRLRLGLGIQSDDNFGTRGFFSIGFSWGGGSSDRSGDDALWARAAENVTRNSAIVVKESEIVTATGGTTETTTTVAVNPATGQAYSFQHVTPDSTSTAGDGTAENPAANVNLVNAQSGDIIYVREGDSRTNPLAAFTVPAGVTAISDANVFTVATQNGDVTLPGSGTGVLPLVNGTGSTAGITLTGGNNRLSGFEVFGATDSNIFVNGSNNAFIDGNTSRDSFDDGVEVFNSSNVTLIGNTFSNSGDNAIFLDTSPNGVISMNATSNSTGPSIFVQNSAGTSIQTNTITSAQFTGIEVADSDSVTVASNIINDSVRESIVIENSNNALVQSNDITGSGLAAIQIDTANNASLIGNILSDSGSGAIVVRASDSITIQGSQITNTTTNTTANGIAGAIFLQEVVGTVDISNNNSITGTIGTDPTDGQGIAIGNSTGNIDLTINGNTINSNQGDGIGIALVDVLTNGAGNGTADIIITNNTIENNGVPNASPLLIRGDAIKVAVEENGVVNSLLIEDNILTSNIDDGIDISLGLGRSLGRPNIAASNAQVLNAVVRNNTVTNSVTGSGIVLRNVGDDGNLVISVDGNTLAGNNSVGLDATLIDDNGDATTLLCIELTNNSSDNDYLLTTGSIFSVVNRDTVTSLNTTGTVNFNPAATVTTSFNSVADLGNCPQ